MDKHFGFRPEILSNAPRYNQYQNSQASLSYSHGEIPHTPHNRHFWRHWNAGEYQPEGAVHGGTDVDGTPIFVGRAYHDGDLLPAKCMPGKNVAYVAYGGEEITLHSCEILCQKTFQWIPSGGGSVPPNAFMVGNSCNGEPLYAGRVYHEGSHCVGKIHPSHGCCYVPFGGGEHAHTNYEVLCLM